MAAAVGPAAGRRWHQALTYAVTGESPDMLGEQASPDVVALARQLLSMSSTDALAVHRRATLQTGGSWPHPVPSELMAGLGYAQFGAALTQLIRELGLDEPGVVATQTSMVSVTPDVRRLLDEVPPHHGS